MASTLVLKVTDHRLLNLLYGSVMPLLALDIVALLQLSLSAGDHLLQHSPSSYTNVTGLTAGFSSWVVHRLPSDDFIPRESLCRSSVRAKILRYCLTT